MAKSTQLEVNSTAPLLEKGRGMIILSALLMSLLSLALSLQSMDLPQIESAALNTTNYALSPVQKESERLPEQDVLDRKSVV